MKKLVVFDIDGTLVRSVKKTQESFICFLKNNNISLDENLRRDIAVSWGERLWKIKNDLFPDLSDKKMKSFFTEDCDFSQYGMFDGVRGVLEKLRAHNIKLALCTARRVVEMNDFINANNLDGFFSRTACVDDFGLADDKSKKHGLSLIKSSSGMRHDEMIFVGDSPTDDLAAALTVGIDFLAVNEEETISRAEWIAFGMAPDKILSSVRDVLLYLKI
jgi:phosphoglycolate phosphatase-like HAD superfamily hydrolase